MARESRQELWKWEVDQTTPQDKEDEEDNQPPKQQKLSGSTQSPVFSFIKTGQLESKEEERKQ